MFGIANLFRSSEQSKKLPVSGSIENGNAAVKIEPGFIENQTSVPSPQEELVELRKKQASEKGWTEIDRQRLLELEGIVEKEDAFTDEEKAELRMLRTKQASEVKWTNEDQDRFLLLSSKEEKSKRQLN